MFFFTTTNFLKFTKPPLLTKSPFLFSPPSIAKPNSFFFFFRSALVSTTPATDRFKTPHFLVSVCFFHLELRHANFNWYPHTATHPLSDSGWDYDKKKKFTHHAATIRNFHLNPIKLYTFISTQCLHLLPFSSQGPMILMPRMLTMSFSPDRALIS